MTNTVNYYKCTKFRKRAIFANSELPTNWQIHHTWQKSTPVCWRDHRTCTMWAYAGKCFSEISMVSCMRSAAVFTIHFHPLFISTTWGHLQNLRKLVADEYLRVYSIRWLTNTAGWTICRLMNTEMMNYTQTDKHSKNELNLYADWWIQQRWTIIMQTDEDSKDELYADWRTQKMNYMQTDKHRRWTIRRLANTERMNEQEELRWHRRQGREMGSGQGKKRNEDRNGVGGSESYRESSDKESETESKKSSPHHSECQRHHQTILRTRSVNKEVSQDHNLQGTLKITSSQFLVVATMENGSVSQCNRLRWQATNPPFPSTKIYKTRLLWFNSITKNAKTTNLSWYNDREKVQQEKKCNSSRTSDPC